VAGGGRLAAVVELRVRLFLRRLRGKGGAAEGIALGLLFLLAIPGSLVFASLVGSGSHRAAQLRSGPGVTISLSAIFFGVWQTWTAVSLSLADRDVLDLRRFLVYPIAPGRVYALGLATSVLGDPFAVFWLIVLGGVLVGAAIARPSAWLLVLALALVLFAAATVALVMLLQEIGARLARSRHFRVLLLALAMIGWCVLAIVGFAWDREPAAALAALRQFQWIAFPPALVTAAARHLYAGDVRGALPFLGLLAGAASVCSLCAFRVALGTARAGGEGGGPSGRTDRPGPLARLDPLLEKELRFMIRSPILRLYVLLLPAIAGGIAWRTGSRPAGVATELAGALPLLGIAAYAHLVTQPFWLNAFGWDRGGARLMFVAPLDGAAVLRAKNRAATVAAAALFALSAAAVLVVGAPVPAWGVVGAVALHLGLAPALHALGNVVSVWNPRASAFGAQRGGHVAPASAFAGMSIVSACGGLFALPVLAAVRLEQPWLMAAGWAALGLAAFATYRATLPATARFLARRREDLLAAVCGDDA
jgi:ABC-2 type transport system permease protein